MTLQITLELLLLVACVFASAAFSGSEIGFYKLSRSRVDMEAQRGSRLASWTRSLMRDDAGLLITILIGNNLALELCAGVAEAWTARVVGSPQLVPLVATAMLTPLLFLFGEVLPKELFRRRPHDLVPRAAPLIAASRVIFWPIARFLRGLSWLLERALRVPSATRPHVRGRAVLLSILAEGLRSGVLTPRAEGLARNALGLRTIPVSRVMVPWERVKILARGSSDEVLRNQIRASTRSRFPVVDSEGACEGYVHALDVLGEEQGEVLADLHPVAVLAPDVPVGRALLTLRGTGRRLAVVEQAGRPVGLVSPKDLLEEISGELAGL